MDCRVKWVDSWRGLLIILVVLGHVIGGGLHFTQGATRAASEFAFKLIYCFHMPAFFFLSGMLWNDNNTSIGRYAYRKLKRLIIPYWIFGVFSVVAYALVGGMITCFDGASVDVYGTKVVPSVGRQLIQLVHGGNWPEGQGFLANSVLWFLPCMFTVQICYYFYNKMVPRISSQILYSIVPLIIIGVFLSRKGFLYLPFGLSLAPYYLIFFMLGRLEIWKPIAIRELKSKILFALSMMLLAIYACLCYFLPNQWKAEWSYQWRLAFVMLAVIGIISSMLCARLFCKWKYLQILGRSTIAIMLVHKFFILGVQIFQPVRKTYSLGGMCFVSAVFFVTVFSIVASHCVGLIIRRYLPWAIGERAQ